MMKEKNLSPTGLHVLVAEDEEYNFLYISEVLKEYKICLYRAYNGKMAVDLCTKHPEINLVLMDVRMPVMDGYEATRQIKALRPDLPVVIQTSYSHILDKTKADEAGCDHFMNKPVLKTDLIQCIEEFMPPGTVLEKI